MSLRWPRHSSERRHTKKALRAQKNAVPTARVAEDLSIESKEICLLAVRTSFENVCRFFDLVLLLILFVLNFHGSLLLLLLCKISKTKRSIAVFVPA